MDLSGLKLSILGLGGAGGHAAEALSSRLVDHAFCHLAALDTDLTSLNQLKGICTVHLGNALRRGLSCGGSVRLGKEVLEASAAELKSLMAGSQIVILIGGLGGGLGGGGLPELARLAKDSGALVLTFAIMPFTLEGGEVISRANQSLTALRKVANACIPLPNDLLLQGLDDALTVVDAFKKGQESIEQAACSIVDMMAKPGVINLDLASLQEVFKGAASAGTLFGIGHGSSVDEAWKRLLASPLLHVPGSLKKADSLLVNITGGPDLSLAQVHQVAQKVSKSFSSNNKQMIGGVVDDAWGDDLQIVIIGVSSMDRELIRPRPRLEGGGPYQPALFEDWAEPKQSKDKRRQKVSETAQRGYFIETELNLYAGEDLDVPTYLRKGITPSF